MKAFRLTRWGQQAKLSDTVVALARAREIKVDVETFSLDHAPEAYARLRRGEIRGRAVIVPR